MPSLAKGAQGNDVKILQEALKTLGYYEGKIDGDFGDVTERSVVKWKQEHYLDPVVTSEEFVYLQTVIKPVIPVAEGPLKGFLGDVKWIHSLEGHAGKPYWPGGESGVTLDPGFDLGYTTEEKLRGYYKGIFTAEGLTLLVKCLGVKGDKAAGLLINKPLLALTITRAQADGVFPWIADSYWEQACTRFPTLRGAPGCVQAAVLSLCYNRGASNKDLNVLLEPMKGLYWTKVADTIGAMQQDHKLEGIRKRRRQEAEYIRTNLK